MVAFNTCTGHAYIHITLQKAWVILYTMVFWVRCVFFFFIFLSFFFFCSCYWVCVMPLSFFLKFKTECEQTKLKGIKTKNTKIKWEKNCIHMLLACLYMYHTCESLGQCLFISHFFCVVFFFSFLALLCFARILCSMELFASVRVCLNVCI